MSRRIKATTIEGAVAAMQNAMAEPLPSPYPLDARLRPVWNEITQRRARDEWHEIDLRFAWHLCDVLAQLHDEEQRLTTEGTVVDDKINPRFLAVTQLSNRALRLATFLRVHPSSDVAYNADIVRQGRRAERAARKALAGTGIDPQFLPQ
jgi:hypothetical protein